MIATNNDTDKRIETRATAEARTKPQMEPPRAKRPFPWRAWLYKGGTIPLMSILYVPMIAEGIKQRAPDFGRPLWRAVPFFESLRYYTGAHRLELTHVMAFGVLVCSALLCVAGLKACRSPEFSHRHGPGVGLDKRFIITLSILALVVDATFFYSSLANTGAWGTTTFVSFSALLLTATYLIMLVAWAYGSLYLED